jgi:hypothetical protein
MQELNNYLKRPNLRIMGTEEEEVQTKRIHNILKYQHLYTQNQCNQFRQTYSKGLKSTYRL